MSKKYYINPKATYPAAVFLQDGQVYYRNVDQWYALKGEPANLTDVAIAFDHEIYGLDGQGHIYRWSGAQNWQQDTVASNVVALTNDSSGRLWCVNSQGQVYYKSNPIASWQFVESDIPAKAGDGGWEYVVKQGDWLWQIVRTVYCTGSNHSLTAAIAEQVKLLNPNVVNWDNLQPGIKLKMPAKN